MEDKLQYLRNLAQNWKPARELNSQGSEPGADIVFFPLMDGTELLHRYPSQIAPAEALVLLPAPGMFRRESLHQRIPVGLPAHGGGLYHAGPRRGGMLCLPGPQRLKKCVPILGCLHHAHALYPQHLVQAGGLKPVSYTHL